MIDKIDLLGRDMLFDTFDDFMPIRNHIKDKLQNQTNNYMTIYRMYVCSRPFIPTETRDLLWDWLNDFLTDFELMKEYRLYKDRGKKHE